MSFLPHVFGPQAHFTVMYREVGAAPSGPLRLNPAPGYRDRLPNGP
jgi:hypothetical protein